MLVFLGARLRDHHWFSFRPSTDWISVILSPLSMILPTRFSVPLFKWTSAASSAKREVVVSFNLVVPCTLFQFRIMRKASANRGCLKSWQFTLKQVATYLVRGSCTRRSRRCALRCACSHFRRARPTLAFGFEGIWIREVKSWIHWGIQIRPWILIIEYCWFCVVYEDKTPAKWDILSRP